MNGWEWCRALLLLSHIVLGHGGALRAQTMIDAGSRVRLQMPDGHVTGRLVAWRADTLVVVTGVRDTVDVPAANVRGAEVSLGRVRHAALGALIGVVAGAVGGFASVVAQGSPPRDSPFGGAGLLPLSGVVAAAGALVGAGVGAIAGALIQTEEWQPALVSIVPR